jgi:GST-like protein
MIDLYTFPTSNGHRAAIMLEACGLPYTVKIVDLTKGEQRGPAYLAINPAGAIPTIVDHHGPGGAPLALSQSGAILLYLATKTGRFLPADPTRRALAYQWLMFATTDCAMSSTGIYFASALLPDKSEANTAFFESRLLSQLQVADNRLADRDWLADELSVADFALYPICVARRSLLERATELPHLARWSAALAARADVARGIAASAPTG